MRRWGGRVDTDGGETEGVLCSIVMWSIVEYCPVEYCGVLSYLTAVILPRQEPPPDAGARPNPSLPPL